MLRAALTDCSKLITNQATSKRRYETNERHEKQYSMMFYLNGHISQKFEICGIYLNRRIITYELLRRSTNTAYGSFQKKGWMSDMTRPRPLKKEREKRRFHEQDAQVVVNLCSDAIKLLT